MFHELTVTISFDGTYVDPRHIMMIVNTMTRGGYIMPLSRHGINRMGTGPLLRCSFEETPDILCDAACFGEVDNGKGVSQNIMTGKVANIGTGLSDIMMNPSMMHPRAIQLEAKIGKKVLKSKIRVRPIVPTQTELVEFNKQEEKQIQHGNGIEMPFDNAVTSSMKSEDDAVIFCPDGMEAPYNKESEIDEASNVNKDLQNGRETYRPSSPIF